jgi:signal transduction histidine kinase
MRILRRPSVRLRFTALYGTMFLLSGVALLAIVAIVAARSAGESRTAPVGQRPPVDQFQEQLAAQEAAQSQQILTGSLIALGIMAVVSLVLGLFVSDRVLRPLRTMTAATRRISADNLHERLAVPGPADEVKDLADTIDGLLERLEGAFAAQRRFVANASHELRTPLATIRASLDVAVAKPGPVPPQTIALADRIRTELDQVDRLLEGFLVLAKAQHSALDDRTTLSLGEVVSASLATRAVDLAVKGMTVDGCDDLGSGWVQGSRTLLCRMVDNVIDNAIIHNHDGGRIHVAVDGRHDTARLVVESGGPVLDQQQVASLAQPFRRLGGDRTGPASGGGLGLSIIEAIATAHDGTLELHALADGGLRVVITLPLALVAVPA